MGHHSLIEVLVVATTGLVALFALSNGFKDAPGIIATVASTRALSPQVALALVAACEFLGALFLGTAVARTVGGGLIRFSKVEPGPEGLLVIAGALSGAVLWNYLSWRRALPTSSGQALLGGLLGAAMAAWGLQAVVWGTAGPVLLVLAVTPVGGFALAAIVSRVLNFTARGLSPRWNEAFRLLQVPACVAVALAYSTNDAQTAMGVMTLGLVLGGLHKSPESLITIPDWVIQICAFSIAFGVLLGGSRMLRTLGMNFYRIRPLQGLGAQSSAAAAILTAAAMGFPASTTQVITTSIIGAGASLRPKAVRWELAEETVFGWLITIPSAAALGAAGYGALKLLLRFSGMV